MDLTKCVCMTTNICLHACQSMQIYVCMHLTKCVCMTANICLHACQSMRIYVCMHVSQCEYMSACMSVNANKSQQLKTRFNIFIPLDLSLHLIHEIIITTLSPWSLFHLPNANTFSYNFKTKQSYIFFMHLCKQLTYQTYYISTF